MTLWPKHPLIPTAILALVLLAGAWWFYDPQVVVLLCMLAVMWQVVCALYYAARRNVGALKIRGIRFLIWIAVMIGAGIASRTYVDMTRARGDSLVAALQKYHAREGGYPASLAALVPRDIAVVPTVALVPIRSTPFDYRSDGKFYSLMYYTGILVVSEYVSTTAEWRTRD